MQRQKNKVIKLGKFVNTHGIKGEIRFFSKFDYHEELQPEKKVFINDEEFIISSSRKHKKFILLTFEGITNINQIEYLKGNDIFGEKISKQESIPEYLGYKVILNNEVVAEVIDYFKQGSY
jgi:16S rRNA processing protein RimM